MAHEHNVFDTDKCFEIDPISRQITNNSDKLMLMQGDHNSEVYGFRVPRTIEGHDMTLCNRITIHYINAAADKTGTSKNVYKVEDIRPDDEQTDKLVFTWRITPRL